MASQDLPVPELSRNIRLIGHTDQGGRPDGVQLMVHGTVTLVSVGDLGGFVG